jgi:MFS family permease
VSIATDIPRSAVRGHLVCGVLGLAALVVTSMQTLVLPLLPALQREFGASAEAVSWVSTATFVASAVTNPLLGRLGDLLGRRRVLLAALALLALASVLGALAPSLPVLILARTLQGASFGVIPLSMTLVREALPPHRAPLGIGVVSAVMGVGGAAGLPLAGIAETAGRPSVFWLTATLAVLSLAGIALAVRSPPRGARQAWVRGSFDVPGAVWLTLVLVAVLLPVTRGASWGWLAPATLLPLGAGLLGAVGWVRYELHRRDPLVDLRTAARGRVAGCHAISAASGIASFLCFPVVVQLVQAPTGTGFGAGQDVLTAGSVLLPGMLAVPVCAPLATASLHRTSPAIVIGVGALVMAVGAATMLLAVADGPASLWLLAVGATLNLGGSGAVVAVVPAVLLGAVPGEQAAAANAFNVMSRGIGSAISSAVFALLGTVFALPVAGVLLPGRGAYVTAFVTGVVLAAVVGGVAALSMRHPSRPTTDPRTTTAPA